LPRALSPADVEAFRARLCDAATRLFAKQGQAGFTLRQLAAAVGVSSMTPYRYFKDKDDILAAVRARAFDAFAARLEQAFAAHDNAATRGSAVGDAYVDFAKANPEAYRLMFDFTQAHEQDYPDLVRATARARATMTAYVRALIDEGFIAGDPELIGTVMWSALHGAVMLDLAGHLTADYDFERVRQELFRLVVAGYGTREPA
jgi:AcrR family transcriptional regulator